MHVSVSTQKPTAYVGRLREEDVPDLMHQLYEPVYGARTEEKPDPFLWGFNLLQVVTFATLKGFETALTN